MTDVFSIPDKDVQRMVLNGLNEVFRTMLQAPAELEYCSCLMDGCADGISPMSSVEETIVVGNVGFVGNISGMVYIAMPESLAKLITQRMLGMNPDEIEDEYEMVNDAIGEITNMSAGAYKNQMADIGYPCRLTIPSIIRGKYFVVEAAKAAFRQIFVFKYLGYPLSLELIMKFSNNGGA